MTKQELNKDVPNFWHALIILSLLLGLQVFIAIVFYTLGIEYGIGDPVGYVAILLASGVAISLLMKYKNLRYTQLMHFSSSSVLSTVVLLFIPIVLICYGDYFITSVLVAYITELFPVSSDQAEMFNGMMEYNAGSIVVGCILAPVIEELLFRGIILRGFMNNYSTAKSIFLSAFLFGCFHLNIYQFVSAFVFGILVGWIYVQSCSLWPCILYHAMFNSSVFIGWDGDMAASQQYPTLFENVSALLALTIGIAIVWKLYLPRKVLE